MPRAAAESGCVCREVASAVAKRGEARGRALGLLAALALVAPVRPAVPPVTQGPPKLTALPKLHAGLTHLDVSNNNISVIEKDALNGAPLLRDLNLSDNPIVSLAACSAALARLRLDDCRLTALPPLCFPALTYLSIEDNLLEDIPVASLVNASGVRTLKLARNRLRSPPAALAVTVHLQALDLSGNQIAELDDESFPSLPSLHTLVLKRNRVATLSPHTFQKTPNLRTLRLEENLLTELPAAIKLLPSLEDLSIAYNMVDSIRADGLSSSGRLSRFDARNNPLSRIHDHAFTKLPHLTTLVLSEASGLRDFPSLHGAGRLRVLRVAHAQLAAVPSDLCLHAPQLRALDLKSNLLENVPDLQHCSELRVLDLSYNQISSLSESSLQGLGRLHDLVLAGNQLENLSSVALKPVPRLQLLNLEDNQLEHIDMEAFVPLQQLEELNVGNNRLRWLPAAGLQRLRHLRAHNNPPLKHFHPPELLPRIETLVLSYAYHCCDFLPLMEGTAGADDEEDADEAGGLSDLVLLPPPHADLAAWTNYTNLPIHYLNSSVARLLSALSPRSARKAPRRVRCVPMPGPFLPCVDLFEWWTLRCGVWAVFLLALLGNGTVVVVLAASRARLDVPRFLVGNLAAADLLMGVYLGALAVLDAGTLGEFRAHAVRWQLSAACRAAGFLAVLSAELSVFTLAVITLERHYAITHAVRLNKRLSLRRAGGVMAGGWAAALLAAALPLLGVSDYRRLAVCLPADPGSRAATLYAAALLSVNAAAFLVLLACYLNMYCAIRGSQAANSNDSRIAKRMALLVFTDFLCWSPIAFFALTAALGLDLVSLEEAKVFAVFVLPLNSCCNPFLYAILTKQFKKDCALVCKAIEESRVTRGIGRCRHSSNFSNRQTPANTNSLAERSSRGAAPCACRRLLTAPPPPPPRGLLAWLRACGRAAPAPPPAPRPPPAPGARAGSVSSSVEFSSSRSDSWRGAARGPGRRAASWLVTRKTSQDSSLSSSRNDSSGSGATASTGTWRTSRSAGSARPRLTRQPAVCDEPPEPLAPRHLHTIPSAAEPESTQTSQAAHD